MPDYRRSYVEGAVYFFTVVTYHRRVIFDQPFARRCLRQAIDSVRADLPWETLGMVLLPDHMHMLWQLPQGDTGYSKRIGCIKTAFTKAFGQTTTVTAGEACKRYSGVWQSRFWEHTIRDAKDFKMHLDYIHVNPVKHGLVAQPKDWPWSSFHRHVRLGEYDLDWCGRADLPGQVEYYYAD